MDAIRVSKVEKVLCSKAGNTGFGTIHLTAHHLIFRHDEGKDEEMWIPYPLIAQVTRLPQTLQGHCPVTFHTRTFESFSLHFGKENEAIDVFESVKELTVATSVFQLYAFYYTPNPPLSAKDGWSLYSPREEFGRMGVGSRTKAWRFTDINKDYSFSPTYPARLVVPTKISDTTLQYASKYRSKCRIPVLTYLHWANFGSITRSSQPMVGLTQSRSIQDEKLIEAIFQSHYSPESRASTSPVYGATTTNLIIDARPTANAMANTAKGAGTENMDHYKEGKKAYLGIDHIHVMRESLAKVVEALREADSVSASIRADLSSDLQGLAVLDRQALRRSGWLRHISAILEGTVLIARNIHINSSHVLIHCSDGWDRTAQLSSLVQLCLDPYYRTIRGFEILVEKDWLSFGHKFLDRCGHLSSDKFFVAPVDVAPGGGGSADAAQAFLASVQNRFASQQHIKETSPVFHQFLESVRQIQRQFPERFEFNERYLRRLHYHLYSCQFGTFLFNCERERRVGEDGPPPIERTISVWDFFNSPGEMEKNLNPIYDASLDDPMSRSPKADMGVLFPNPKDVRFWNELYGRTDEEMNGRIATTQTQGVEVLGLAEGAEDDPAGLRVDSPSAVLLPPSPVPSPSPMQPSRSVREVERSPLQSTSKELSASMPNVARRGPDISAPNVSTSSSISLRPPTSPGRPASPGSARSPPSPNRSRTLNTPGDLFGNSGMKSVWGKLSSNASAAFSVVQEAYGGVAKDLKGLSLGTDDGVSEKTAELRSRDHLSAWGEEDRPSSSRYSSVPPYTISSSTNPWATVKPHPGLQSDTLENPWSSVRSPSPQPNIAVMDIFTPTSLPSDPTVAHPMPTSSYRIGTAQPTRVRDTTSSQLTSPRINEDPTGSIPPRSSQPTLGPTNAEQSDPLGVGLM